MKYKVPSTWQKWFINTVRAHYCKIEFYGNLKKMIKKSYTEKEKYHKHLVLRGKLRNKALNKGREKK